MKHFLALLDSRRRNSTGSWRCARRLKAGQAADAARAIQGRILGMVFFNPSLRTRTSFEAAMLRFGGHAITLSAGGDTWRLEHRDGVVMDGDRVEHVREGAAVLGRYCDVLGVARLCPHGRRGGRRRRPGAAGLRRACRRARDQSGIGRGTSLPGAGRPDDAGREAWCAARQAVGADIGAAGQGTADGRVSFGNPCRRGGGNARDDCSSARLRAWRRTLTGRGSGAARRAVR